MKKLIKAWNKFFGSGWTPMDIPSRLECFESGYIQGRIDGVISTINHPELIKMNNEEMLEFIKAEAE